MPYKPTNHTVSTVEQEANAFVVCHLKPKSVSRALENAEWAYLIDITTGWKGSHFYFIGIYRDPRPDTREPIFKQHFALLASTAYDNFTISYMHHSGKFSEIDSDLILNEAIELIRDQPVFQP